MQVPVTIKDVMNVGFSATLVNSRQVPDYAQLVLNNHEKVTRENNVNILYFRLTNELYECMRGSNGLVNTVPRK